MRKRGERGVSRKNQTFLQRKSSPGPSIAPALGTSSSKARSAVDRLAVVAPLEPWVDVPTRPPRVSTEPVHTTEASAIAAAPSEGVRDADRARSRRPCSARGIHRLGLMTSILVGGLGLGFLLE